MPDGASSYPAIEAFIERATPDEVGSLFRSISEALDNLKGPKTEHAKKVRTAVDETQALLRHLLEVRAQLESAPTSRKPMK